MEDGGCRHGELFTALARSRVQSGAFSQREVYLPWNL